VDRCLTNRHTLPFASTRYPSARRGDSGTDIPTGCTSTGPVAAAAVLSTGGIAALDLSRD
jgi:hypothetical protein